MSTLSAFERWMRDLQYRDAEGQLAPKVSWSRAREPDCVHAPRQFSQPASACVTCSNGPELTAWKAYWRALGNPDLQGES